MNHCFDLTHFHGGKTKFNPQDGLVCSFWGAPMWFSLHAMAANFPVELDLQKKKRSSDFATVSIFSACNATHFAL